MFYFQPLGVYSVSKTTLLGLTRALAGEVTNDNIRVNCVAPGIVATKFASVVSYMLILDDLGIESGVVIDLAQSM